MAGERLRLICGDEAAEQRLDVWLALAVDRLSRSQAKRLLDAGQVSVDGTPGRPRTRLRPGQVIALELPTPEPSGLVPEEIPLAIVYEDPDLLVLNKPAGMVVHPSRGHRSGTLVHALLAHCDDLSGIGGELRPGIVHRLDRDTSGLLVVAKHDAAHRALAAQIADRTAGRRYLALVHGTPAWETQTVDQPLGRHPSRRQEYAVVAGGRPALTRLERLESFGYAALLAAELATGRTHQIRIHCTWLGHPLCGDPVYGRRRRESLGPLPEAVAVAEAGLAGQALHAARLSFRHPADSRPLTFTADPPPAFATLLTALRQAAV